MSNNNIKEAEIERLKAQTGKIIEEKRKIEIETAELIKKYELPWYRKEQTIKVLIAAILALPVLWFFFDLC